MQTQVICLLALMGASTLAAAETPPAQAPSQTTSAPAFNGSDDIPNPKGFADAYSLDEVRIGGAALDETQQIERWQAELAAGRARAGTLVGAFLSYRALTPADCDVARDALTKADELGSDQAPLQLAALSVNPECGAADRAVTERWLKKAVPLDYPRAAQDLIQLYGSSTVAEDKVQKYTYARVAAGYWDATKAPQARDGFDASALAAMEKDLAPADKARAEADAARILDQMMKRHDRFTQVTPAQFAHGDAGSKASYLAWSSDYRHECQWNLKNNCKGAQRLAYVDLENKGKDFLSCRLELNARDVVTGAPPTTPLTRQVLLGPSAKRRLLLGDVSDVPDKKALVAKCGPVPNLMANLNAGRCRAKLQGGVDVEKFYPEEARSRGVQGSTVVRYWVPPKSDVATDAEIATSSGDASLDDAAIATVRSGKFSCECDYGLSSIRIAFKLQE
jgi:TonB family protein